MTARPTRTTAAAALALAALLAHLDAAAKDPPTSCEFPTSDTPLAVTVITGPCKAPASTKAFKYNVISIQNGGNLIIDDDAGNVDIWARAILIENGGKLTIGDPARPIGTKDPKTRVTIHLYGAPTAKDSKDKKDLVFCSSTPVETCGAPTGIWNANLDGGHEPKHPPGNPFADPPDGFAIDCAQAKTDVEKSSCVRKVKDLQIDDAIRKTYPGQKDDYFYGYHPLFADAGDHMAYFGTKVLAVSYGGTLQMFGRKGAIYTSIAGDADCKPGASDSTGRSWVRLAASAKALDSEITVTSPGPNCRLNWADGDDIVITTTDYLPAHSEQRKIKGTPTDDGTKVTITLDKPLAYHHNGERFHVDGMSADEKTRLANLGLRWDLSQESTGAETRAAVGLLSRNIRIVSEGCALNDPLPGPDEKCKTGSVNSIEEPYFGGHTVFRQGLKAVQIQGVEFYQMGQGGRLGHYPVHFHHARKTFVAKADTIEQKEDQTSYVMDSSIWDSMTRWIVLHGTSDVTLARNVGYKSIGHGFYLEDGTEINNRLLANLGVWARPAVINETTDAGKRINPRKVPGILAAKGILNGDDEQFPYKSDADHPTVFWIMNGWNDFEYNMAAGAGTCGACYWLVSGINSGMSKVLKWESYASMQTSKDRAGSTPLRSFKGNSCTSAMSSFQTVTATQGCTGVRTGPNYGLNDIVPLKPVENPLAGGPADLTYFPHIHPTGGRFATRCGGLAHDPHADCSTAALQPICSAGKNEKDCMVTVLDRYTTSFNWAAFNFAAIWLRPQWYLLTHGFISDVQQAGLTMVTGGGYSASDVIPGHWALTRKTVFVGHTQPDVPTTYTTDGGKKQTIMVPKNPYAADGGPFNGASGLRCAEQGNKDRPNDFCLAADEGISFQIGNAFAVYQRLFSVYDGPAFQDSNAYFNIASRKFEDCSPQPRGGGSSICNPSPGEIDHHRRSAWWAGMPNGVRRGVPSLADPTQDYCYMPNAAIGWKQPNGFYYPPAFHSTKLFFHDVETRHFVVTPLFQEGTLKPNLGPNPGQVGFEYCTFNELLFQGFTSVDRQTVLNDDDGTLTGYASPGRPSIVVNDDPFFAAPVEAMQCASDDTSRTSPYEHVTTVVYPQCATNGGCAVDPGTDANKIPLPNNHKGDWDQKCSNENCYGVPLIRHDLLKSDKGLAKTIRMMGQATGQRSTLTVNHGTYYLDTSVTKETQVPTGCIGDDGFTRYPKECNLNVFKPGETYYLFLIYAKETTEQTYRIYIGPTSETNPRKAAQIQVGQANIEPNPVVFSGFTDMADSRVKWFDQAKGIIEVKFGAADLAGFATKMSAIREKNCQPTTYCGWDSGANQCKLCSKLKEIDDPADTNTPKRKIYACDGFDATADICRWASYDPHCPEGGCVALKFTMPGTFVTGKGPDARTLGTNLTCKKTDASPNSEFFQAQFTKVKDATCPAEGPPPANAFDDRLELNFSDVTPADCQDTARTPGAAMKCSCPP